MPAAQHGTDDTDFDGIWKDALERMLREFFALLFPAIAAEIDWEKPVVFLDKELDRVIKPGKGGRAIVDKLVRVQLHCLVRAPARY